MKVIGYVRVSTQEQASEGVSLAAQEAKIRAYCELYGLELLRIERDAGFSAKTILRPGLSLALSGLDSRSADGLVIFKLDRLSRSVGSWAGLVEQYFSEKAGKQLFSVTDCIDTRTAGGRLVLNVLMSVAQWEREAIGERTTSALAYKKSKGECIGQVPYGYRREGDSLIEDPAEQRTIEYVHTLRVDGLSLRSIADQLKAEGMDCPSVGTIGRIANTMTSAEVR